MTNIIATDAQRLEQDVMVDMFELDLREYGEGVLRFCPGSVDEMPAVFNGYTYYPVPVTAEGFKWDGQGTLPKPTLSLSTMDPTLSSMIRSADDLIGVPVRRIRTYRRYLDDGETPDPEAMYPVEEYAIERKSKHNSVQVEFELSVSMDQEGRMIPGRQVIRDSCTHTYRSWNGSEFVYRGVTCPFAESRYFKPNGDVTHIPSEDRCGKKLSDCERRYGKRPLPFYGFPGAGQL